MPKRLRRSESARLDVLPAFASKDSLDVALSYPEFFGECPLRPLPFGIQVANTLHLGFRKLSRWTTFAAAGCSVANSVGLVVFWRVPSEIVNVVVCADVIRVASVHPVRTWPDERQEYETVDMLQMTPAESTQDDLKIPTGFHGNQLAPSGRQLTNAVAWAASPNAPVTTRAVAGEVWNRNDVDGIVNGHDLAPAKQGCGLGECQRTRLDIIHARPLPMMPPTLVGQLTAALADIQGQEKN